MQLGKLPCGILKAGNFQASSLHNSQHLQLLRKKVGKNSRRPCSLQALVTQLKKNHQIQQDVAHTKERNTKMLTENSMKINFVLEKLHGKNKTDVSSGSFVIINLDAFIKSTSCCLFAVFVVNTALLLFLLTNFMQMMMTAVRYYLRYTIKTTLMKKHHASLFSF